ncbi:condensation domain-containing protein [Archangium lansingense]|uniref:condensation domain-containing protein n=1 Tax=Archangium lansingense TaxID=2995310 RepID=UPI003B7C4A15
MASSSTFDSSSLLELSRRRAESQPEELAYTFLVDGETEEARLTYAGLDARARAIGGLLQELGAQGERVLLLYPPGLDYVTAFVGCIYAGAIAVPAYPPDPMRLGRTLPRLEALISDARARFALTNELIRSMADGLAEQFPGLAGLKWVATDEVPAEAASAWKDPGLTRESLAFLQYTSGSTGTPRGVMLSHGNLLHNSKAIQRGFEPSPGSVGVIWLPPYHDMGLIGGVLQPLFGGFPVVLMSPLDFLKRPARWLEALSRYRGTHSGGPNFAYDLCVRKTTPEQRAALDLSSWSVAFNGAEPVRAATLDRFAEAFAISGFRREAFYPCYGLAEGTLFVTGGRKSEPPVVREWKPEGARGVRQLVGCGTSAMDQELLIVHPETLAPVPEGQVGEIWVRGGSVAQGYWNRPELSEQTFRARRSDTGEGPWLRTGDLGFLSRGELFVAGRIKDLIIIRGRNLYPQDLEQTAEASHPALRPGCSAAFSLEADGQELLVLVHEVDRAKLSEPSEVVEAIRRAVAEQHEVAPGRVVLVPAGHIPKTSSGKIQRSTCRAMYLAGELELITESAAPQTETPAPAEPPALTREALRSASETERTRLLGEHLRHRLARALAVPASALDEERPLTAFGLDSIHSIELKGALEEELGIHLPVALLLDGASLGTLTTRALEALHSAHSASSAPPPLEPANHGPHPPLSYGQERLLFLDQLATANSAYNIAAAVRLEGRLDVEALGRSLAAILRRHDSLRARFPFVDSKRVQVLLPAEQVPDLGPLDGEGTVVDLSGLPEAERETEATRLTTREARHRFDLERGPLLRAKLLKLAPERHRLVLSVHHIVSDGWTMGVLVRELGALYPAFAEGRPSPLPAPRIQYTDYAAWQRRWLEGGTLASEQSWWKERLTGLPPLLELPGDRPHPATQSFEGARHPLDLSAPLTVGLEQLGQAEGATPFMVLLAGFLVTLHQRTGRTDLVVGTDIANREHPRTQQLVGLFVNQLVLRVDLSGNPTFRQVLARVRQVALGAYAHPHVPFDKLVETLRPPRDTRYNPLFQVMFVLENAPLPALELPGLRLELLELDDGGSPFDLSVLLSKHGGKLGGVLRYSTALFDGATIARLGEGYQTVLSAAVQRPDATLEELRDVLAEHERQRERERAEELKSKRQDMFRNVRRKTDIPSPSGRGSG